MERKAEMDKHRERKEAVASRIHNHHPAHAREETP
jgi:hypothetical protein